MILINVTILIFTVLVSKRIYRNVINPINIFIGLNLLTIILAQACNGLDGELSGKLYFKIYIMFIMFIVGMILGRKKIVFLKKNEENIERHTDKDRIRRIIIIYSILNNIFSIYYLYYLEKNFGIINMFSNMPKFNAIIQNGEFKIGIYSYFIPVGIPLSLMILYYIKNYGKNYFLIIQYFMCYILCISPRRDMLFLMIAMSILFVITQSGRFEEKIEANIKKTAKIAIFILIAIYIMSITQKVMNKEIETETDMTVFGITISDFLKTPFIYIAGNYPYLNQYGIENVNYENVPMLATFRLLYKYLFNSIGMQVDTSTAFELPFLNIGNNNSLLFNTAPILYYFIKDSGKMYFIEFIILGYISKRAMYAIEKKNSIGNIMLGIYVYQLLLFSFRSYNLIYLSNNLALIYIYIAYKYTEIREKRLEERN